MRLSKFLSLHLRHDPAALGIALDAQGWTDVAALLAAAQARGVALDRDALAHLVANSDKGRFELDGDRIRARQGHTVAVDLALPPATPPDRLYHGTPTRNRAAIEATGLHRGERHHVHLSPDVETARRVGDRRGPSVVFVVDAAAMAAAGHVFHVTDNGVWLTDAVPPAFLRGIVGG